ncbi:2-hydroxychromene-2-carboxylate isomerase [Amaricoccus macauensis]|uniref:2-hydroxychromene-2-carboxylate isomerase n=1 Tax=Amaricoccus macauensis TaxID=57001 RepID=UPI003C7B4267
MPLPLTFWFEFASTYSYLSAMRVNAMAAVAGVSVTWRPVPLGPIFAAQGWSDSPFNIYPAKGAYMWRDMERRSKARGLPLRKPDPFPQNSVYTARVALAALETPQGPAFCQAIYTAQFAEGRNIADPETIRAALTEAGLPETLAQAADDPARKAELKANSAEAMALGLFGAPSYTVGRELFWGDDRLEDALEWARSTSQSP